MKKSKAHEGHAKLDNLLMIFHKSRFLWWSGALVIIFTGGELSARYYLGLGTPPLSIEHPTIEYMYKPNQDVMRFDNRFIVNQYGMRTKYFAKTKAATGELRIMVFGDSVINGGSLTDHKQLATTLVSTQLTNRLNRTVIVGNISAGSWGPSNWLAYAKEYGFFDADVVVIVISSHDISDIPQFLPLDPNSHPTVTPVSALLEGLMRYLPRYLPHLMSGNVDQTVSITTSASMEEGARVLREFLQLSKKNSPNVLVVQHLEQSEIKSGKAQQGYEAIRTICQDLSIHIVSLEKQFRDAMETGPTPYRDDIHPTSVGQAIIAKVIMDNVPVSALGMPR